MATDLGDGCTIGDVAHRAISLAQLRRVIEHAAARSNPAVAHSLTLAQVASALECETTQRSLAELVALGPQPPDWVATHAPKETAWDVLAALERHAADRRLGQHATYWLSSTALTAGGDAAPPANAPAADGEPRAPPQSAFEAAHRQSRGWVCVVRGAAPAAKAWLRDAHCAADALVAARASDGFSVDLCALLPAAGSGAAQAVGLLDGVPPGTDDADDADVLPSARTAAAAGRAGAAFPALPLASAALEALALGPPSAPPALPTPGEGEEALGGGYSTVCALMLMPALAQLLREREGTSAAEADSSAATGACARALGALGAASGAAAARVCVTRASGAPPAEEAVDALVSSLPASVRTVRLSGWGPAVAHALAERLQHAAPAPAAADAGPGTQPTPLPSMRACAAAGPFRALGSVDLTGNALGVAGVGALARLLSGRGGADAHAASSPAHAPLTSLTLAHNKLGDPGAEALAAAIPVDSRLRRLRLRRNDIRVTGARALAGAVRENGCLEELDLTENELGDGGAISLAGAFHGHAGLRSLELAATGIGDDGVADLATALQDEHCKLVHLGLGDNDITHVGVVSIATGLRGNTRLTALDLRGNEIAAAGAAALAGALREPCALRLLHLGSTAVTNAGVAALAGALHENSTLTALELRGNRVGDAAAVALAHALGESCALEVLDLRRNRITAAGGEALAQAVRTSPTLACLDVGGNQLDASALRALEEAAASRRTPLRRDAHW